MGSGNHRDLSKNSVFQFFQFSTTMSLENLVFQFFSFPPPCLWKIQFFSFSVLPPSHLHVSGKFSFLVLLALCFLHSVCLCLYLPFSIQCPLDFRARDSLRHGGASQAGEDIAQSPEKAWLPEGNRPDTNLRQLVTWTNVSVTNPCHYFLHK